MYFSRKFLNAITPVVVMLVVSLLLQAFSLQPAKALSGSEFQAGRIIDDVVFNDKGRMNSSQIQEFLNAKLPVCDTNGTQMYNSTQTRAQWAAANGRPLPPYTCLKDYSQSVPGVVNGGSDLCKSSIAGGVKSAAQIIYDVAQACSVNPQVLIVLLQKEQSLITDSWPWPTQYQAATGYGCPDTAPCDAEFYGFFNQVYQAAKAFRRYEANPNSYNYKANRNNYIYYHPSLGACGGTNVFIQNQATASLYIYTPYQPNAAALNNLYGTGDGCSAYGNRNFWRMFNDWFGSTRANAYSWQVISQTYSSGSTDIISGQTINLSVVVRNTGHITWQRGGSNPVLLAPSNPDARSSSFANDSWISSNRTAFLQEQSVAPGQTGTFQFSVTAPEAPGIYLEYFNLVSEGNSWFIPASMNFYIRVVPKTYSWQILGGTLYANDAKTVQTRNDDLSPGEKRYVVLNIRNTGNQVWVNTDANPIRIGTSSPNDRSGLLCSQEWIGESCSRPSRIISSLVNPSQATTLEFWIKAPSTPGYYGESLNLLTEGIRWFEDPNYRIWVKVL